MPLQVETDMPVSTHALPLSNKQAFNLPTTFMHRIQIPHSFPGFRDQFPTYCTFLQITLSMFTKTDIEKYFLAEKQESLILIVVGSIALLLAIAFFFFLKTGLYKGAALPLLVIGLIQLAIGIKVYSNSDKNRIKNVYAYDMNPDQLKNEELPRIKQVKQLFVIFNWLDMISILVGMGLMFYYKNNPAQVFWYGLGISLTIQAALMLGADSFAEKRARAYAKGMEEFLQKQRV